MSDIPLIVPTALTNGTLHFVEVSSGATAQDVINALVALDGVTFDILGNLEEHGWALQKIRREQAGRKWEEEELDALGDGILASTISIAPLVTDPSRTLDMLRHFSFPMTSHLHSPVLRLVSLHPQLRLTFTFARVPEVHDDLEWKVFLSRTMTVNDVVTLTMEELGLMRSLPVSGSANLEYVLEEVWADANSEKSTKLPSHHLMHSVVASPFAANPFSRQARRCFRFCVPEEWYRGSKTRTLSPASATPSESTIRQLTALVESEEGTDEGTAKFQEPARAKNVQSFTTTITSDWRTSLSQNRLSSFFDGWMRPPPTSPARVTAFFLPDRKNVSEPKLLENEAGRSTRPVEATQGDFDEADFEKMVDDLGLKGKQRAAMFDMSLDRKRYLLQQNQKMMAAKDFPPRSSRQTTGAPVHAASYSPATAASLLPRLVPQLTGDTGLMRRISLVGRGSNNATPPVAADSSSIRSTTEFDLNQEVIKAEDVPGDVQPLQSQNTGGWTSWWASSGGEKASTLEVEHTAKWYVDGIRSSKTTDLKLAKHLISLRVHLSTAKLVWIQDFINREQGLQALNSSLASLVRKGGKMKDLNDVQVSVLLRIMKCLRVLLNTEVGFDHVLVHPMVITHIAYSLHVSSLKVRTLASELLAAICILSPGEGHKTVLGAISDCRVVFEETFRFESLVNSLRLPDMAHKGTKNEMDFDDDDDDDERIWEARTASMSLINALANYPEALEERILLREELGRRGLNEFIVALRYVKPPDSLTTQLDVYTEEKFEDEADVRERARSILAQSVPEHERSRSDSEVVLEDLVQLAKQHGELYPMMIDILNHYAQILQRDVGIQLKADLFTILDRFVEQAALLDNFDDSWHVFLKRFAASVQHITGQELEVKAASDSDSLIEQELEALRSKVEELSDERAELRNKLNQQVAEMNALKSLPIPLPVPKSKSISKAGQENFHGLVQRLVLKEKQVLQLQAEVDRFKAQNPTDGRDSDERAKRDRERAKWNTLMEEIAKLKKKNGELECLLGDKDKEILYLKRALESVYTRFLSREEDRQEAEIDAEIMAKRTIETMTQKDAQIASLCAELAELKAQLSSRPKYANEKEFKAKSPPPPPPPKPKRAVTALTTLTEPEASAFMAVNTPDSSSLSPSPAPPAPPPPPPPQRPSSRADTCNNELWPTPPPPAPTPPVLPLSLSSFASVQSPPPAPAPPPLSFSTSGNAPPPPPPPPPPPSGPFKFKTAVKPMISRPAKKLKPFFWNKLNLLTSSTIWDDFPSQISFDVNDLEATFAIDNLSTSPTLPVSPTKKQNVTTLLDISRANHVAIMLSRIKLSFSDIRKALLELDDNHLNVDNLKALSKHLPTPDEIGRIKDFGDVSKLAIADQYFSHVMTIPRLSERLDCMLYRRKLDLDIAEIRPDLDTLRSACHELRSSTKFKHILQAVLVVGNTLNGSTFRGGARGFQLDALLKLKETKTAKGFTACPTLLHYITKVLMRTDPHLVDFVDDIPHLEGAARVSVQAVTQSINALSAGLDQVKGEIKQLNRIPSLPSNDRFIHVMQSFVDQVEHSVNALRKMSVAVEDELKSLLLYFGEQPDSPDTCKPEDFFGLIVSFSSSLQKCALEVNNATEKQLRPSVPVVTAKTRGETVSTLTNNDVIPHDSSQGPAAVRSIRRGDYDQAIRSMRDGKRRERPNRPLSKIFLGGG